MRVPHTAHGWLAGAARGFALALLVARPAAATTPALLYRADFDRGGHCLSRTEPGVGGGGAALLLRPGDECALPADGRLNPKAGTLSFWAKPQDWSDGEGRDQILFEWSGRANGEPFQLSVDSPPEPGVVRLLVAYGAWHDRHQRLFQIYAPITWRAGLWQKVDVTWDEHEMVLYANGVAGDHLPLETMRLPPAEGGKLRITPGPGVGRKADATAIDELELWDAPLPADRIAKRFRATGEPKPAPARLRAPRVAESPQLDGRLDDAVWSRATRVPLLPDAETGFAGLLVAHAAFVWNDRALQVAFEAPLTDPADSFDLTLAPAAGGAARTLHVTPRGLAVEDAATAAPIEVAARSGADAWSAEIAIPWSTLGGTPRAGEMLTLDLRHRPRAPGGLGVGGALAGAALELGVEGEGVRVGGAPDLALGRIAFRLEREAETGAELRLGKERELKKFAGSTELVLEPDAAAGLLHLDVTDGAGPLVQLETRIAPLDVPGLLAVPDTARRSLAVELDLGWLDARWVAALAQGRARARLVDHGPEREEGPIDVALTGGRARIELTAGLAPGRHRLALELAVPGEELTLVREVEVPELPWLGTQVGESEAVLDPWLPLAWDDDATVRVWGRRYVFAGPLLAGVVGRGGPMLRAPMALRVTTAAGVSTLRTTASQVTKRSASRAEFQGTGTFEAAGLDVGWSAWIEYDGLVFTTLTLTPRTSGMRVERLELEVPLQGRFAKYLRGTLHGSALWRGRVPWNGQRFQSSFEPFLWLSDEEEGFLWFTESAANWVAAEQDGAVEVRGGAEAGIRLRLIGEPVTLPGPVTYRFGFEATPVKPMLPDARAWNFSSAGEGIPGERAIAYYDGFAVVDGLWQLQRPIAVADRDRQFRRRGVRPFYFGTVSATPDIDPTFRLFAPLWRSAGSVGYPWGATPASPSRDAIPEHRLAAVCPADPDWQDRMLYDADQLLRATGALGLYTDTDEVLADDNERHGCGYLDAFGKRGTTWTMLSKRRFAKRLATLLRHEGDRRYWMSHAHTRLFPPVTGFADFWYPGEELTGAVSQNPWFYTDGLDEVAWRVEYRGESSGIVHVLLPELERGAGRSTAEDPAYTEAMLAMAAVNDVNVSSPYTHPEALGEYWQLRERLGIVSAEFVGHWRGDCPVRALGADARASLYRTPRGPVLVVANRAAEPRGVDVQVDAEALGISPAFVAKDERSGGTLERSGERLVVPLGARSYTFVSLR